MTKSTTPKNKYTPALGRRRAAVANVKLFAGKSGSQVNGLDIEKYFPGQHNRIVAALPFLTTDTEGKYYFTAKIVGGGKHGQMEALILAISRALKKIDEATYRPLLRAAGLLTVDARVRQRRQVGTGGKARRQKQSPKR